jgi:hypothetical protein
VARRHRAGVAETLPELTESIPGPLGMNCATPDGQWIHPLEVPFANPARVRAFTPEGELVRAGRESYTVEIVDPESGEVVRSIRRAIAARRLLPEDWERTPEGAWIRQYEREGGGRLVDPQDRTAECPLYGLLPELAPPIRITVTPDGRILVEAANPGPEGGYRLAPFDAQGSLVGEAEMPDRDGKVAPFARGNLLYLVAIDDLDVQSIMIYELR